MHHDNYKYFGFGSIVIDMLCSGFTPYLVAVADCLDDNIAQLDEMRNEDRSSLDPVADQGKINRFFGSFSHTFFAFFSHDSKFSSYDKFATPIQSFFLVFQAVFNLKVVKSSKTSLYLRIR